MARRDWDRFARNNPVGFNPATGDELYELGIRRPEDVTRIDFTYNFKTELWEITFETDYGTFILEDTTPNWYDDAIRRGYVGGLYDDGGEYRETPEISKAYNKAKGGR